MLSPNSRPISTSRLATLDSSSPAFTALAFAFVVFLFTNASRGPLLFFVGLFLFALSFAFVHFSYVTRSQS